MIFGILITVAGHKKLTDYPEVHEIAQRLNATPAQVLIAWGVKRGYSVIPKSVTPGARCSLLPLPFSLPYNAHVLMNGPR